ncbi:MAG TPA: glutathione S-transferase family protein [Polyangiaceae bacterium]|jgi:glutathione S-transferase
MHLYFHPLSTYSQKTLIALYEKDVRFTPEVVSTLDPVSRAAYKKIYPLAKLPLLVDADRSIPESSIIIEYIDQRIAGPAAARLIPSDPEASRRVRFHDRMFDLYLNNPVSTLFFDSRKPPEKQNPEAAASARETIEHVYDYLENHLAKNTWAYGDTFTMADCAAAPALGYLRMIQPFSSRPRISTYWNRLAERPSFARVLEEAKPYLSKM